MIVRSFGFEINPVLLVNPEMSHRVPIVAWNKQEFLVKIQQIQVKIATWSTLRSRLHCRRGKQSEWWIGKGEAE